jgi:two-component system response regulator NreC
MRVVLADDHRVFLDSFRIAITQQGGFQVVGQATTAATVASTVQEHRPDLLVMDLMFEGADSLATLREIRGLEGALRILILTVHDDSLFVRDAFDCGADGYALKDQPLDQVVEAMRLVASGQRYQAPALGEVLLDSRPRMRDSGQIDTGRLSRRENEIFRLIVEGRSSREIATSLSISLKTVETHRAHINKKLGVRSPAELIRMAALRGLLVVPARSGLST